MDAIVLVGGLGTRLRPLTETRHKSLVPVCNRAAIEYLFDWIEASGFGRVILALGRHNEDLADAYRAGRPGKLEMLIVEETERLESGGAIRNAVQEAGTEGRFAVLNGDVFVDFDFRAALATHEARGADLTIALCPVPEPSSYGVAVLDESGLVTGFVEKPPIGTAPSDLVNAGVWIFEKGLVEEIPPGPVRVEETLFPSLVARRRTVLGHVFEGLWADIGTPERYLELNAALALRAGGAVVAATARCGEGALLRESSAGNGSVVGPGAMISASILWERVVVGRDAIVNRSVLADGVHVGDGARLDRVVAGSGATIAAGAVVPPGTRIDCGGTYER
ncbi:MAG: sugar phosphate nucleotidyltransferase [Dehalococcoidia bacterium]